MTHAETAMVGDELLTVAGMMRADAFAQSAGIPVDRLMEAAGKAVADAVAARWSPRRVVILAGPGNNGGDGFVAARHLSEAGWPVCVALLGEPAALQGAAGENARRWQGDLVPLSLQVLDGADLIIDALFGAGLSRPLAGIAAEVVAALPEHDVPCVAVDIPSGVHGDSGAVIGTAVAADLTVTFFRKKPGHLLLPGREFCGDTAVADIGIPLAALAAIQPRAWENSPRLWCDRLPWPRPSDHKYSRGHLVVCGGSAMTGAARLAARAGQRVGAGLVTIAAPPEAVPIYAAELLSILVRPIEDAAAFYGFVADARIRAVVVGPGNGISPATRAYACAVLEAGKPCVLDADGLSVFAAPPQGPADLFKAIAASTGPCVLTPHEGEFSRLFGRSRLAVGGAAGGAAENSGTDGPGSKLARARQAARVSGATVLLKGYDTVIAAPDGRAAINVNAPATLATAGAGDVLAGAIGGLLAQGVEPFSAACAAAWLQGEAAAAFGPGLIAEDLLGTLPSVLRRLA